MDRKLVITCEHAGNKVPEKYRHLFEDKEEVLNTHRGIDIGALELTQTICSTLQKEPHLHKVTRLLIDLNRSLHNPSAFSEFVEHVGEEERQEIIDNYYLPHRQKVKEKFISLISEGYAVFHLSVHTFTPILNEMKRNADIAFLYDPGRTTEKKFCWRWRKKAHQYLPDLKFRMNYPYRGTMDGFNTALKKEFTEDQYWGVELEVNQKFAESKDKERWKNIQNKIALSLKEVLSKMHDT